MAGGKTLAAEPADKAILRKILRKRRLRLWRADPVAADRAAEMGLPDGLGFCRVVAGYHAVGSEMDPRPLLRRLARSGAAIALPAAAQRDAPLIFRAADHPETFIADAFGIPAPPPGAPVLIPDLVIVPLLAFDRRGGRLGQGAGCYDRTLRALRERGAVFALGLAFAGQEIDRAPTTPDDEALDAILTETGYIPVVKEGS